MHKETRSLFPCVLMLSIMLTMSIASIPKNNERELHNEDEFPTSARAQTTWSGVVSVDALEIFVDRIKVIGPKGDSQLAATPVDDLISLLSSIESS